VADADDIDRLYQAPLAEFTAKRNELIKQAKGADKAQLRGLEKPTLPAWAVNQLYWRKRKTFDRVLDAARRRRVEHGRQLSGKAAEVELAESRHRDAVRSAIEEIREILQSAGEKDTPATMLAVNETLEALPERGEHGRLVKPLKPQGFEALAGLLGRGGGATIARLTEVRPERPAPVRAEAARSADPKDEAARRRRESQARAKDVAAAERALRRAESEERTARADYSRAEMSLVRLQRERKELQQRIDVVTSRRDQAAVDLDERRRAADRAGAERERLELSLKALKDKDRRG
jgi:hypothetical protein